MQNNNPNNYLQENEIDLKEIFKLLINSKKLIIIITLVITTLGAIYAFQKTPQYRSTALIEIGNYELDEYNQLPIEHAKDLLQELTINFIHKQKETVKIKPIEDRLIQISHTSPSSVTSEKIVNKILAYINNRHSLMLSQRSEKAENQLTYEINSLNNQIEFSNRALLTLIKDKKLRISNEIESLNTQIEFSNRALLAQNEDEKLRISNEIESLNNQIEYSNRASLLRISNQTENLNNGLPTLNTKIEALNKIIVADTGNLLLLKSNPDLLIYKEQLNLQL